MTATLVNAPKGPALLAKAGVSLDDAKWLYAHKRSARAESVGDADPRMLAIKSKVQAFLARQIEVARGVPSFA